MLYYKNRFAKYSSYIRNLGFLNFIRYWMKKRSHRSMRNEFFLKSPLALYPLVCRPQTSDIDVFKQIYAQHEYSCLTHLSNEESGLIIDCGANAGFSTAYLLSHFPQSTVFAVEPDPGNYATLLRNVKSYSDRVQCFRAAIWSKDGITLNLSSSDGDGREWARTVGETYDLSGQLVESVSIGKLLTMSGFKRVKLLKIDIEGAEKDVFSESSVEWLAYVDCIVIELHGTECEEIFMRAVLDQGFKIRQHMELTIAER